MYAWLDQESDAAEVTKEIILHYIVRGSSSCRLMMTIGIYINNIRGGFRNLASDCMPFILRCTSQAKLATTDRTVLLHVLRMRDWSWSMVVQEMTNRDV